MVEGLGEYLFRELGKGVNLYGNLQSYLCDP